MAYKSNGGVASVSFDALIKKFGVVTVMDAYVFDTAKFASDFFKTNAYSIAAKLLNKVNSDEHLCTLDTLTVSNINISGPNKTITGGRNNDNLLKYGKTARLEMQDALGSAKALAALAGGTVETNDGQIVGIHFGNTFPGARTILGKVPFVAENGSQQEVYIVLYRVLPDATPSFSLSASGDATVFDLNGDLQATTIKVGNSTGSGMDDFDDFYSIISAAEAGTATTYFKVEGGKLIPTIGYDIFVDNSSTAVTSTGFQMTTGTTYYIVIKKSGEIVERMIYTA